MPSFDVVSEADMQEVDNAVGNANRQISQRYDLKDTKCTIERNDALIILNAEDAMQSKAIFTILKEQLAKRGISLKLLDIKEPQKAGGDMLRQEVVVKQGLSSEELKRLNKMVKAKKFKVSCQIQGEQLRVSGKKRDELQAVIQFLKQDADDLHLQFENFRD